MPCFVVIRQQDCPEERLCQDNIFTGRKTYRQSDNGEGVSVRASAYTEYYQVLPEFLTESMDSFAGHVGWG